MKRLHAYFSGSVQGIGFRYITERLARHFPVTGFVKNLANGKVEVVAEGDETDLKDFLKAVESGELRGYIREVQTEWEAAKGEFKHFGVSF